jgi:hypothetical protein
MRQQGVTVFPCVRISQGFRAVSIVLVKHLVMAIKGRVYDISQSRCGVCMRRSFAFP